ncbi:hypothetical protein V1478_006117 [Vespula squamosa]|uniref:Uncharacterized protein n=1 Tax=Vespula squamosa TaxID=30214 RepID=A0ABD2B701_VESSQ
METKGASFEMKSKPKVLRLIRDKFRCCNGVYMGSLLATRTDGHQATNVPAGTDRYRPARGYIYTSLALGANKIWQEPREKEIERVGTYSPRYLAAGGHWKAWKLSKKEGSQAEEDVSLLGQPRRRKKPERSKVCFISGIYHKLRMYAFIHSHALFPFKSTRKKLIMNVQSIQLYGIQNVRIFRVNFIKQYSENIGESLLRHYRKIDWERNGLLHLASKGARRVSPYWWTQLPDVATTLKLYSHETRHEISASLSSNASTTNEKSLITRLNNEK